jgi:predicted dehydrogenase
MQPFLKTSLLAFLLSVACSSPDTSQPSAETMSTPPFTGAKGEVKLITLDPGHFHAALVQKNMYPQIDSVVHVYAPDGDDLQQHLKRIEQYNTRADNPTHWTEEMHTSADFFNQMIEEKPGNLVVLSGNNAKKTEYIHASLEAGLNVLADKPMVIEPSEYSLLEDAFRVAQQNDVLLYDIMTERYEITTALQRALSQQPEVFGELVPGTVDEPAISKESVHHFFKYVSGNPLVRPAWFFDVTQQGEGIVDVSTHLVDLILWETFPDQPIDTTEVEVVAARRWATELNPEQFEQVTGLDEFPDYLQKDVQDGKLSVFSNGEINFTVRGVHGKASVIWNFQAPEGAADTHYSIMRGTKANLVIRQDAEQNYQPTLYVELAGSTAREELEIALEAALKQLNEQYPGLATRPAANGWEIVIPDKFKLGHEAHFAQVMERYLQYLVDGELPEWELRNMLTKYYVTMQGYQMSR